MQSPEQSPVARKIAELKHIIAGVPCASDDTGAILAKQIMFYLLSQSALEDAFVIDLKAGKDITAEELQRAREFIHDIHSDNGATRLSVHFCNLGIDLIFRTRRLGDNFEFFLMCRHHLLSHGYRSTHNPKCSKVTRGNLNTIDLLKTGYEEKVGKGTSAAP